MSTTIQVDYPCFTGSCMAKFKVQVSETYPHLRQEAITCPGCGRELEEEEKALICDLAAQDATADENG